ncbi:MAG: polysaccharide biosynthesis tyrosine autokinase, partial [Planctomycetia bacterium]|nr:polysaccharide biosynthesis tyrosine autokinase [Planctomycetia bacterium]
LPPALQTRPDAQALLLALRRRWLLACCVGALGAFTAALGAWLFVPAPKPVAQALLHVDATQPWVAYHRPESRADFQNYQRTQIALVKSRFVLNAALRHPEVAALPLVRERLDPVVWLQKELLVDFSVAPEILRVGLTGHAPDEMTVVVGKVARAYLDEVVKREDGKRRERHDKLKEIHERYQENLRAKRRTLRDLVENVGSGDPNTLAIKQRLAQEQLAQSTRELSQLESDLRRMQTELGVRQNFPDAPGDVVLTEADLDDLMRKDPTLERLQQRRAQLEQDILEALRVAARGEDERAVQLLRGELVKTEALIEQRRREARPLFIAQVQNRILRNHQGSVTTLGERLKVFEELRKNLVKDIDRLSQEARTLNKGSLDIETYKQEIAQAEDTAKKVATELEAMTVEFKAVARISELESAAVSQPDDTARRLTATGGAALAGLLLSCLTLGWWEHRARRVQTGNEIEHGLGIAVVGTVPPLPPVGFAPSDALGGTAPLGHDPVDAVRAMLLHTSRTDGQRVLLVTSAVGGEGKTSLVGRLGLSLARSNRRTLLIDCDLRNPNLHRAFQLQPEPGLCEVMEGALLADEAVQSAGVPGLSLLAAGQVTAAALQGIGQENLRIILDKLRDDYDFILIDACPVLPVADALLIGMQVDGVLLSVLHDRSQLHQVYAAAQSLQRMGANLLGAVVNGLHRDISAQDYHYGWQPDQPATPSAVRNEPV